MMADCSQKALITLDDLERNLVRINRAKARISGDVLRFLGDDQESLVVQVPVDRSDWSPARK